MIHRRNTCTIKIAGLCAINFHSCSRHLQSFSLLSVEFFSFDIWANFCLCLLAYHWREFQSFKEWSLTKCSGIKEVKTHLDFWINSQKTSQKFPQIPTYNEFIKTFHQTLVKLWNFIFLPKIISRIKRQQTWFNLQSKKPRTKHFFEKLISIYIQWEFLHMSKYLLCNAIVGNQDEIRRRWNWKRKAFIEMCS